MTENNISDPKSDTYGLDDKSNEGELIDGRIKDNFVNKNVVNLSKRNLSGAEILFLSKDLNFVPICKNIDKAKDIYLMIKKILITINLSQILHLISVISILQLSYILVV